MKNLFKIWDTKGMYLADGQWFNEFEAREYLLELFKKENPPKRDLIGLLDWGYYNIHYYIVIERRTGNIVNGCGLDGIEDLKESGYNGDEFMIQSMQVIN